LRAAQAYMLISMPTGTSTILGVFQAIASSEVVWRELRAKAEPRSKSDIAQVRKIERLRCLTADISLTDKAISLLNKALTTRGDLNPANPHENSNSPFLSTPTRKSEPTQQGRAKHPNRNDRDRCGFAVVRAPRNFAGLGAIFGHCLFRD
jgi:hypothetical protein